MLRPAVAIVLFANISLAQAPNLSGTWAFTHDDNRIAGTVLLRQSGTDLTGTWHTSRGKTESDTPVAGRLYGITLMLTRFISDNQQNYSLTLSADGSRLDGFGEGWFLNHTNLNMTKVSSKTAVVRNSPPHVSTSPRTTASRQRSAAFSNSSLRTKKQTWMGIGLPPQRRTYRWVIQSVAVRGASGKKYSSFYYDTLTGGSVEQPLSLSAGGEIVGVFPDDCAFSVQDQAGTGFTFRNEDEANAHVLGPGTWSVYPLKCGGIGVYVK